jgi:predicted enzyme related to lactoylglutathione lyase
MARIAHFDVIAEDVERAIGFYESTFGWKFTKWEGPMDYWMISTGPGEEPGIDGGLSRRENSSAQVERTRKWWRSLTNRDTLSSCLNSGVRTCG